MSHNAHPIPPMYLKRIDKRPKIAAELLAFSATWQGEHGALLLGPTDCGKSFSTARACQRIRQAKTETWIRWIRADELSRMLSVRGSGEEIELLKRSRVLVLDELGYEHWPDLCLEMIGSRYDHALPTVVTSGLKRAEFLKHYGDATLRKIIEVGDGALIDCWKAQEASSRATA